MAQYYITGACAKRGLSAAGLTSYCAATPFQSGPTPTDASIVAGERG